MSAMCQAGHEPRQGRGVFHMAQTGPSATRERQGASRRSDPSRSSTASQGIPPLEGARPAHFEEQARPARLVPNRPHAPSGHENLKAPKGVRMPGSAMNLIEPIEAAIPLMRCGSQILLLITA